MNVVVTRHGLFRIIIAGRFASVKRCQRSVADSEQARARSTTRSASEAASPIQTRFAAYRGGALCQHGQGAANGFELALQTAPAIATRLTASGMLSPNPRIIGYTIGRFEGETDRNA